MNAPPITTYVALAEDPDHNPHGTGADLRAAIELIYEDWSTSGRRPSTADELMLTITRDMSQSFTGGIGIFVEHPDHPGGTLDILHSFHHHSLGVHRNCYFGYRGDVDGIDIDTVEVEPTFFERTPAPQTRIFDDTVLQLDAFAADEDLELVPVHAGTAENTHLVHTRNSMYIPACLLPLVLGKDLKPREALSVIVPALDQTGLVDVAAPLVEFLMVASTRKAGGEGIHVSPVELLNSGLTPQAIQPVVRERRKSFLYHHLPALTSLEAPRTDPTMVRILHTMQAAASAAADAQTANRAMREKAAAPRTINEKWPNHWARILLLCHRDDVADCPQFWHDAAAWKKGNGGNFQSILNEATARAASEMPDVDRAPSITVQHASAVQNLNFVGPDSFTLSSGFLPFTVTPPGAVSAEATLRHQTEFEQNADHATLMEGSMSISNADARALRSSNAYIPLNFEEAEMSLNAYAAMLGALLGVQHGLTRELLRSLKLYKRIRLQLQLVMTRKLGPRLAPATLVYFFHVQIHGWFEDQWHVDAGDRLPAPDLLSDFKRFERGHNLAWLPDTTLVPQFDVLRQPAPTPRATPTPSSRAGAGANATAANAPPTAATANNEPAISARSGRTRTRNRHRDERFNGDTPLGRRIRDVYIRNAIAIEPAPLRACGSPFCLTWHVKGTCFTDCTRASSHVPLNSEDTQILYDWCKIAYPESSD